MLRRMTALVALAISMCIAVSEARAEGCIISQVIVNNIPGTSYPFGDPCDNPDSICFWVHIPCPNCDPVWMCFVSQYYSESQLSCTHTTGPSNFPCGENWQGWEKIQGSGMKDAKACSPIPTCPACPVNEEDYIQDIADAFKSGGWVNRNRKTFVCDCESNTCRETGV